MKKYQNYFLLIQLMYVTLVYCFSLHDQETFIYFFGGIWGLNSELHTCQAGVIPLILSVPADILEPAIPDLDYIVSTHKGSF
jgi:hypothetical protein